MSTVGLYSVKVMDSDKNPIEGAKVEFVETGEIVETEHNGIAWSAANINNSDDTLVNIYASNVGYSDELNVYVKKTSDFSKYTEVFLKESEVEVNNDGIDHNDHPSDIFVDNSSVINNQPSVVKKDKKIWKYILIGVSILIAIVIITTIL